MIEETRILRQVTFWPQGSRFQLSTVNLEGQPEKESGGKRGRCGAFGRKSRARLLQYMATVRADVLPWFLTLTYPADWPLEWNSWKYHLERFTHHFLCRDSDGLRLPVGAVWKLEPQQRGAPHFHAIVYGYSAETHRSVNELRAAWSKVIGTNCPHHSKYGLDFNPARSIRGVMAYAGKRYLGKTVVLPEGWEHVGRYWGVVGRKHVPVSASVSATLTAYGWSRVKRLMRRTLHARGKRLDGRCNNFYTQAHRQWHRAFCWAEGEPIQSVDFTRYATGELALALQPF
jgi:hypothetical protein